MYVSYTTITVYISVLYLFSFFLHRHSKKTFALLGINLIGNNLVENSKFNLSYYFFVFIGLHTFDKWTLIEESN